MLKNYQLTGKMAERLKTDLEIGLNVNIEAGLEKVCFEKCK